MSTASQILLVGSNLVLAAAVSFHVLKSASLSGAAPMADLSRAGDLRFLTEPTGNLEEAVNRLNLTLQRFNTTTLQYEYLQKEIERLGQLDQTLVKRIHLEETKPATAETEDAENALKQLQVFQGKVRQELKRNRESMVRLIEGIERQLDSATQGQKAVGHPGNVGTPGTETSSPTSETADPATTGTDPE